MKIRRKRRVNLNTGEIIDPEKASEDLSNDSDLVDEELFDETQDNLKEVKEDERDIEEETEDEREIDPYDISIEDLGIELEDATEDSVFEEIDEETKRNLEEKRIEELKEKYLKEMTEKEDEPEVVESGFDKIKSKLFGGSGKDKAKVNAKIIDMDEEFLKEKGYPKKIMDPTDKEVDEDGNVQYFFNIKKTLANNNLTFLLNLIGEERLIRMTYDDDFLDRYADKQHKRAENYNNMSPLEQYLHDRRKKRIRYGGLAIFIIIITSFVMFQKVPERRLKQANALYNAEKYEESYEAFNKLSGEKAEFYKTLSFIKASVEKGEFEDAKKAAEYLGESGLDEKFGESSSSVLSEIIYQEALSEFSNKNFDKSGELFKSILGYKESEEYYNKSVYELSDSHFEDNDLYNTLKNLYGILDHADSKVKFEKIANAEYLKAMKLYNNKEYDKAVELFRVLSEFKYKDSSLMTYQCQYKRGLDLFEEGKFDEAIKILEENRSFKDSQAVINEAIYRKANSMLLSSPAKANIELSKIRGFRDVDELLKLPIINLYGEWSIYKADGNPTERENFVFNVGRKVQSNKPIKNLRISSKGDEVAYNWEGDKFVSEDGLSSIQVVKVLDDEIEILATNQGSSTLYNCIRKNSLYDYVEGGQKEDKGAKVESIKGDGGKLIEDILEMYVD